MSRPEPLYTHPKTGKKTRLPESLVTTDKTGLSFLRTKNAGWAVGGWYSDAATGEEFIVKFDDWFCYNEKLLNDLARICIGPYAAPEKILISHGKVTKDGESAPEQKTCIAMKKFENFYDLQDRELAEKKSHSLGLHEFYVFNAIIGNDDLNEENLGVSDGRPIVIDYGMFPRFLHAEQIEHAATPFTLASFIGHRNLNGMQLVRRRHFGHDDFLLPAPFKQTFSSPQELTYEEILLGVKKMIATKEEALAAITTSSTAASADLDLPEDERAKYQTYCTNFSRFFAARIEWMEKKFGRDLESPEKFSGIKWSSCSQFHELMQFEEKIFKEAAARDLERNFTGLSELLEDRSRKKILELDLRSVEKSDIVDFATKNFMAHNALVSGDYEMLKWLTKNELYDVNCDRMLRTHNYQLFRTTPLHAAIAIYHDKLFYQKSEELSPLREVIDLMAEKFCERNPSGPSATVTPVNMTFWALDNFRTKASEEAVAATKIQRGFRAYSAARVAGEEAEKERE